MTTALLEAHSHTATMTLQRRVSFSDDPPLVVEVEAEQETDLAGLPVKTEGVVGGYDLLYIGEHGESLAPTLAEDLQDQRRLEVRLAKAEAHRALLWERLRDAEVAGGVGQLAAPHRHARERKVSFSCEPEVIPPAPPLAYSHAAAAAMACEWEVGRWGVAAGDGMEAAVAAQTRQLVGQRERVAALETRQVALKGRLAELGVDTR